MISFVLSDRVEIEWYVGNPSPVMPQPDGADLRYPVRYVVEARADGAELAHVAASFFNLPQCPGKTSVRWFGDNAKFIFHNL